MLDYYYLESRFSQSLSTIQIFYLMIQTGPELKNRVKIDWKNI